MPIVLSPIVQDSPTSSSAESFDIIKPSANSTTAIQLTQADGSTAILTVDSTNKRIGIGAAPGSNEKFVVTAQATADIPITAKGMASQAGVLIRAANSDNTKVMTVDKDAAVVSTLAAAANAFLSGQVSGDSVARVNVQAYGKIAWSTGSAAADLTLERSGVGTARWTGTTTATNSAGAELISASINSTGTPAAGFGARISMRAASTTTADQPVALIQYQWATATDASRAGELNLYAYNVSTAQAGMTIRASGSGVMVSVYGATPVVRASAITAPSGGATQDAEARTAITSLINAIKNFGITA